MSSIHGFKTKDLSCPSLFLPSLAPPSCLHPVTSQMICRIKTAVAPQRSPSTERAEIYTPVDRSGEKIYGHRCGVSPDLESQLQEDDEEEEEGQREGSQGSLGEIPEKAVMVRGRWASV